MQKVRRRRKTSAREAPRSCAVLALVFLALPGMSGCALANGKVRRSGVPASATVMSLDDTCWRLDAKPVFRIGLRVEPERGPAFDAVAIQAVALDQIPEIEPGNVVAVHYHPKRNHRAVVTAVDRTRVLQFCWGSGETGCNQVDDRPPVCEAQRPGGLRG